MIDHKGPNNENELSDELKAEYGLPIPPKRNPKLRPFSPKVLAGQFGFRPYQYGQGGFYNRGKWSALPKDGGGYIPPSRRGPSGEPI